MRTPSILLISGLIASVAVAAVGLALCLDLERIQVSNFLHPAPARVYRNGTLFAELDGSKSSTKRWVRGGIGEGDSIRAEVLAPDGWRPVPAEAEGSWLTVRDKDAHGARFAVSRLCIDNRGGARRELRCGEVAIDVAPDRASTFEVLVPSTAVDVRIDRVGAGRIETKAATYLLDLSGARRYGVREVAYGLSPFESVWLPEPLTVHGAEVHLVGRSLRTIDFLVESPRTIDLLREDSRRLEILEL